MFVHVRMCWERQREREKQEQVSQSSSDNQGPGRALFVHSQLKRGTSYCTALSGTASWLLLLRVSSQVSNGQLWVTVWLRMCGILCQRHKPWHPDSSQRACHQVGVCTRAKMDFVRQANRTLILPKKNKMLVGGRSSASHILRMSTWWLCCQQFIV